MRVLPGSLVLLLALAACGDGSDAPLAETSTRDSAGITIVDNGAPAWPEGGGFVVEPAPMLESQDTDDPESSLQTPAFAIRAADGSYLVLDATARIIKHFGADGAYLGALGRLGQGPGEFQAPIFMARWSGDSVITFDIALRRWQVFGPDFRFGRQQVVEWEIGPGRPLPPQPQGLFSDGSVLARQGTKAEFPFDGEPGEVHRDTVRLVRLAVDGAELGELGTWASGQTFGVALSFGDNSMVMPSQVPLAPIIQVATDGERAIVGTGERWELVVTDMDGTWQRIVRRPVTGAPISPALRDSAREAILDVVSGMRGLPPQFDSTIREAVKNSPFPDAQPAHGRIVVDERGYIWVENRAGLVPGSAQPGGPTWAVLSPEGIYQGDVTMPDGLAIHAIGPDWVLGSWRDADDVAHLRLHRLRRPDPATDS